MDPVMKVRIARKNEEEQATMPSRMIKILAVLTLAFCALGMEAQMLPNPYGPPISVENAKKAAAAALAEAVKNHWVMAVAVVDPTGTLVYYEKTDNTQIGSANVSINKARSAALYKRPTKAFQDALAGGGAGLRVLGTGRRGARGRRCANSFGWQDHRRDWRLRRQQ